MDTSKPGTLYVVPTPIGNLEDITLRALRILKEVDLIAAEDTRTTRKLLTRYEIHTPMTSYAEHNRERQTPRLIERILQGSRIALVSEAGTPLVSDPGYHLINAAIAADVRVEVLPGASAVTTAAALAAFGGTGFRFVGFVPRKEAQLRERLAELLKSEEPVIIFESPRRVPQLVQTAAGLEPNRPAALIKELTKLHEQALRGTLSELVDALDSLTLKGEFVLVLSGREEALVTREPITDDEILRCAAELDLEFPHTKRLAEAVAQRLGIPKREAYRIIISQLEEWKTHHD